MGYSTQFRGEIALSRPLTFDEAEVLLAFNDEPESIAVTMDGFDKSPPSGYFQWVPTEELTGIVWDGNEKFYDYTEWMQWLVLWLQHRGITAAGQLYWSGEEPGDTGVLTVKDGVATAVPDGDHNVKTPRALTFKALRTKRAQALGLK